MDLTAGIIPLAVFLSVTLLALSIASMNQGTRLVRERLNRYASPTNQEHDAASAAAIMRDRRLSSVSVLDLFLRQAHFTEGVALDLARAALPLKVGEYLLLRLLCALALALVPIMAGLTPLLAFTFAGVGFYLPKVYVKRRQQRRLRAINDQLVDLTTMISNSLKSGYSFVQGLEMVSRELPKPISEEVAQVLTEMSLGTHTEEALINLAKRVNSYDLDLIVTAMLIQRQVGGNLAEILDKISSMIRGRVEMIREVQSLTSEVKLSAYVVGSLPVFLMAILSVASRSYINDLLNNPTGQALLGAAFVMEIIGFIILRRITAIEV
ncbi:MAG: type II secretion system F family protein [Chloroflexi bacterium]|nr:type II secretion system F family protein [Chloroflexota bacterium]